jgi:endo-beta-N-acetylglucosaminidase D
MSFGWGDWGGDLSSSDGVLGCAAGEVVDFVVLDQVPVKGHVFFFCEDCIVGFDIVSAISGQLRDGILFKDVSSTVHIRKVALKGGGT